METRIKRWGNSLALRIPRSIAAEAGVDEDTSVDVRVEEGAMIVRPVARVSYDLKELLRKVKKSNLHGEIPTGRPRGREEW